MRKTIRKNKLALEVQRANLNESVVFQMPVKKMLLFSGGMLLLSSGGSVLAQENVLPVQYGSAKPNYGNTTINYSSNQMTVHQLDQKAILNWKSFDIGKNNKVVFDQPGKSSVALNKIYDQKASEIEGQLTANGQVYLVNPNGFVFHAGSVINTNSFIASALNIDETLFQQASIASANNKRNADYRDRLGSAAIGTQDAPATKDATITVESGASINVGESGAAILVAPNVENLGEIRTGQSGQIILAGAEDKVYLAPGDENLRGFLVEVQTGGTVTNSGKLFADQGNISMVGSIVNQKGIVRATSSVNLNGSVVLKAQDKVELEESVNSDTYTPQARRSGTLTLGENSKTEVINATSSKEDYSLDELEAFLNQKAPDVTNTSSKQRVDIELDGKSISIKNGSSISATGGTVQIKATSDPKPKIVSSTEDISAILKDVTVDIDSGAVINVSGSSTTLPMSRNLVEVQLFSNELKDSPLQKDGPLKGKKVIVDARKGTNFADVSAAIANIPKNIDERNSTGGKIIIQSEGGVVAHQDSLIDVSGGKISFDGGMINTTKLIQGGKLVDISDAKVDEIYDGIAGLQTLNSKKWGTSHTYGNSLSWGLGYYEPGYTQGQDAGTLSVTGRSVLLDGKMIGNSVNGTKQRDPSTSSKGGLLEIGVIDVDSRATGDENYFTTPEIIFTSESNEERKLQQSLNQQALVINAKSMLESGFTRYKLNSDSSVSISKGLNGALDPINIGPGGELSISAPQILVSRSIAGEGSSISFKNISNAKRNLDKKSDSIVLENNVSLDVSGGWINDLAKASISPSEVPVSPKYTAGGNITLSAIDNLSIGEDVGIIADGGAYLSSKGKLKYGAGGGINIGVKTSDVGLSSNNFGTLNLPATMKLSAFGAETGGSLELHATTLVLRDNASSSNGLFNAGSDGQKIGVDSSLFNEHGFSSVSLVSGYDDFVIESSANIDATQKNYQLKTGYGDVKTGESIHSLQDIQALPVEKRSPIAISFTASDITSNPDKKYNLVMQSGASVAVEPGHNMGGAIEFNNTSGGQTLIYGNVSAPAGSISIDSKAKSGILLPFDPRVMTLIGKGSELNAAATFVSIKNAQGMEVGNLLPGGSITVSSNGYVIMDSDSAINIAGAAHTKDFINQWTPTSASKNSNSIIYGDAGTLSVNAGEGAFILSRIDASADKELGAKGGSFTLDTSARVPFKIGTRNDNVKIEISQNDLKLPENFDPTSPIPLPIAEYNGLFFLSSRKVSEAEFDDVNLISNEISLDAGTALTVGNSLILNTSNLSVGLKGNQDVTPTQLQSNYIKIGRDNPSFNAMVAGTAELLIKANWIDLTGKTAINGIDTLELNAEKDIRTISSTVGVKSGLISFGQMVLSASQIEASTESDFVFAAFDINNNDASSFGKIEVNRNASEPDRVYSAQSSLNFYAHDISISGVVNVPFGSIGVHAESPIFSNSSLMPQLSGNKGALEVGTGAILSTSLDGTTTLFGQLNSGDWYYGKDSDPNQVAVYSDGKSTLTRSNINLDGKTVAVDKGATLDLSGGGSLRAYQFIQGSGGSKDVLDQGNVWAILPGMKNSYAAYDLVESNKSNQTNRGASSAVYISGLVGFEDGYYPLLPAHYALLPGAVAIRTISGYSALTPGKAFRRTDGTNVLLGYFSEQGTKTHDSNYTAFQVLTTEQINKMSEFNQADLSDYMASKASKLENFEFNSSLDAAVLSVNVDKSLKLNGTLKKSESAEGKSSEFDLSSDKLIVSNVNLSGDATDGLVVNASELGSLGFDRVVLGANLKEDVSSTTINANASSLIVDDGVNLSAKEIILAAKNILKIGNSAKIESTAEKTAGKQIILNGDSAVVMVSNRAAEAVSRNNQANTSSASLDVGSGTILGAKGAIVLDAIGEAKSDAELAGLPSVIAIGGKKIALGETDDLTGGAISFSSSKLAELLDVDNLILRADRIDFGRNLELNSKNISFDAAVFGNLNIEGQTGLISANRIAFANSGKGNDATSADSSLRGDLSIKANNVSFGGGNYKFVGFNGLSFDASSGLLLSGESNVNFDAKNISFNAPIISSTGGSLSHFSSNASINIGGGNDQLTRSEFAGGQWFLSGSDITVDTSVSLPSGVFSLEATSGDIHFTEKANIDLAGKVFEFGKQEVGSAGGYASFVARNGQIYGESGSTVDVSGTLDESAGFISFEAPSKTLIWQGKLISGHSSSGKGGSIEIDVDSFANSSATSLENLNLALNENGFDETRIVRLRNSGGADVAVSGNWDARNVDLSVDNGNVTVSGSFGKHGDEYGDISIAANGSLNLAAASMVANSVNNHVGKITLRSGESVNVDDKSTLDVSGDTRLGVVRIVAPRSEDGQDVSIGDLKGNFIGAEQIILEGMKRYDSSLGESVTINGDVVRSSGASLNVNIANETQQYLELAESNVKTRFVGLGNKLVFAPGITLNSGGDLTVLRALDIAQWYSSEALHLPGELILKAKNNLNINANISDGFYEDSGAVGGISPDVGNNYSYSYILSAGADLSAAKQNNSLKAYQSSAGLGNIYVGTKGRAPLSAVVRTGTGDIIAAAASDFEIANNKSALYTGGKGGSYDLFNSDYALKMWVPVDGGDVIVNAGNDIKAPGNDSDGRLHQIGSEWLRQVDASDSQAKGGWYVDFSLFEQNFGALAGGSITLQASHDLVNVSAAAPTLGNWGLDAVVERIGAGSITAKAGHDANGVQLILGDGKGSLVASNSVGASRNFTVGNRVSAGAILAVMGGDWHVTAGNNLILSGLYDPSSLVYSDQTTGLDANMGAFSYVSNTSINLTSLGGNVNIGQVLGDGANTIKQEIDDQEGNTRYLASVGLGQALSYWVPSIEVCAAGGGITQTGDLYTPISDKYSLKYLSSGDISINGSIASDYQLSQISSVGAQSRQEDFPSLTPVEPLKFVDDSPEVIYSKNGSIDGTMIYYLSNGQEDPKASRSASRIVLPKSAEIFAGKDVKNIMLNVTNNSDYDITYVNAGRDVLQLNKNSEIKISGSGELFVNAGRDIDLGVSKGVSTIGNLFNTYLPEKGASVTLLAGTVASSLKIDSFMQPIQDTPTEMLNDFVVKLTNFVDANWTGSRSKNAEGKDLPLTENEAITNFTQLNSSLIDKFNKEVMSSSDYSTLLTASQRLVGLSEYVPYSSSASKLVQLMQKDATAIQNIVELVRIAKANSNLTIEDAMSAFGALTDEAKLEVAQEAFSRLDSKTQRGMTKEVYSSLSEDNKRTLATDDFFYELRQSGRDYQEIGTRAYDRGFLAVQDFISGTSYKGNDKLETSNKGDISFSYSKVYTQDGGDINILAPGGSVDAGRVTVPARVNAKPANELGVVAQAGGQVRAYVQNDFMVNQSRVFTLGDDDILMWSSAGNLDAGKGAKTTISAPAPVVTISATGAISVDFGNAISGSGIRAYSTPADHYLPSSARRVRTADVDLVAPVGEVNAGEAGIGSSGNVRIAAARVVGADNIDVGGLSFGVPSADVGGLAAGLSGFSGLSSSVSRSAEDSSSSSSAKSRDTAEADATLSWLEVTVSGFEDEGSSYAPTPASTNATPDAETATEAKSNTKEKKKPKKDQQI